MTKIRQPIITVAGHVDHGKTSILDKIRETSVAEKEAGSITQKISFTELPKEIIKKRAGEILKKFHIPLEIPGFLFIDTPGHAAFINLRKRGGSLADLAILVIDINEGIKPQTAEVLQILKANKTPFIIALNKIDNISGWRASKSKLIYESLQEQAINVKQNFDEKIYTIIGALNSYKIEADLYTEINDFTKKIAIVPCSARTGEGISEILAVLCALSQKFLTTRIQIKEQGKGVILEVKKEKSINYLESILYDGKLSVKDEIVIASFGNPIVTKIRNIQKALPLTRGFKTTGDVEAAAGMRLQIMSKENILPGMPFQVINNNLKEIEKEFKQELSQEIKTDKEGIIVKADSLGSLEAVMFLLRQKQIKVMQAGIGDVSKKDVYVANSLPDEEKIILGFNVGVSEEVEDADIEGIKMILNPIVYKIIEDYEEWKKEKLKEIEKGKLEGLTKVAKLKILPFVFRNSNPAIFGVKVEAGTLVQGAELINSKGEKIARVKAIQEEKTTLKEAAKAKEIAISLPGVNFERQLKQGELLYSNLSEFQFRKFKENRELLSSDEKSVLGEIAEIKRRGNVTWGV